MFYINFKDMKWFVETITKWLIAGNILRPGLIPVLIEKYDKEFRHE